MWNNRNTEKDFCKLECNDFMIENNHIEAWSRIYESQTIEFQLQPIRNLTIGHNKNMSYPRSKFFNRSQRISKLFEI